MREQSPQGGDMSGRIESEAFDSGASDDAAFRSAAFPGGANGSRADVPVGQSPVPTSPIVKVPHLSCYADLLDALLAPQVRGIKFAMGRQYIEVQPDCAFCVSHQSSGAETVSLPQAISELNSGLMQNGAWARLRWRQILADKSGTVPARLVAAQFLGTIIAENLLQLTVDPPFMRRLIGEDRPCVLLLSECARSVPTYAAEQSAARNVVCRLVKRIPEKEAEERIAQAMSRAFPQLGTSPSERRLFSDTSLLQLLYKVKSLEIAGLQKEIESLRDATGWGVRVVLQPDFQSPVTLPLAARRVFERLTARGLQAVPFRLQGRELSVCHNASNAQSAQLARSLVAHLLGLYEVKLVGFPVMEAMSFPDSAFVVIDVR